MPMPWPPPRTDLDPKRDAAARIGRAVGIVVTLMIGAVVILAGIAACRWLWAIITA